MHPAGMSRVIEGKRYAVDSSTLIASNHYWDGSNFERNGRNTWLHRTSKGNYFVVNMTRWSGVMRDTLFPVTQEHAVGYEEAFPQVTVEEA